MADATKKLFAFHFDCGRMGDLNGLFISTDEAVKAITGQEVNFGEVLGKHSEISGPIEAEDITEKSADQDLIEKLEGIFGATVSGYSPFDYIEEA
jgi:hypothetical protein